MQKLIKIYTIFMVLIGLLFLNFTVDDSFITFRYGKNLIDYGLWNWNPSSIGVVEAYTNPLYAFISIIPHFFGFNVLFLFKALGIILIMATYLLLSKNVSTSDKWYCAAFVSTNILIFPHAFSGLETIAFFLAAFYVMTLNNEGLRGGMASALIFLAPLIRPEGAILSIYILYMQFSDGRVTNLARTSIVFGLLYFIARYWYFGALLPNTFYAKSGDGVGTLLSNIRAEVEVICAWGVAFVFILQYKGRKILPILLFLGYVAANLTAELQMNYLYRFAWHMLFPAYFYAFWLVIRSERGVHNSVLAGISILFIVSIMINFNPTVNVYSAITYYQKIIKSHRALGQALSKYQKYNPVLAVGDAGLIPYYSGLNTIDYVGLANYEIAHSMREGRAPLLQKPDILIVYSQIENSCKPGEYSNAKFGLTALMGNISESDYICLYGPNAAGSFYLNMLVDKKFIALEDLTKDIRAVKRASELKVSARDAILFPGLR